MKQHLNYNHKEASLQLLQQQMRIWRKSIPC
ncbi:hypothetical protein JD844_013332 [Phrynosoma platyrhinos]|uniref:Uncharacterized protein n=1 Tax=Phrynosoma platyrhinos TaxID=52577 RepID=A0ABQ7TMI2_PHRPL|nr:hypothetical protein JD844_013332 [Phrynosoma platyrhinos]